MSLFTVAIAIHVILSVVGVGLVGAIPIVASSARRAGLEPSVQIGLLEPLFRTTRASLALVFLTGALIEYSVGGAFHSAWWFRVSVLLFVFLFFAHRRGRAALPKGPATDETTLRRVEHWGWAMCGAVALIALLMTVKPF
jgi:hypothetical protein